jgi:SAM-dependent methyltransferase
MEPNNSSLDDLLTPKQPYEHIAAFYDRLMSHVDYDRWANHVRDLWAEHRHGSIQSLFDAACGTGRFLEIMREPGMDCAGCDLSKSMIDLARQRLATPDELVAMLMHSQGSNQNELPEIMSTACQLSVQDLRHLQGDRQYDLVTCLYDSINYLLDERDFCQSLKRFKVLCKPTGLIVFDICTERNSLDHFLDYRDQDRVDGFNYERHSYYDVTSRLHRNDFAIWKNEQHPDGEAGSIKEPLYEEAHVQRIWQLHEVQEMIRAVGLEEVACYAEFGFHRGTEDADRVHFVVRPR